MPGELLPIGTFARRCRLSVKALRHYDELALLPPHHVDAATGYRYYHRRQAPAALAIALLRSLDVPLPAIRELLTSEDSKAIARVLGRERERRAQELSRAAATLRSIERLAHAGTVFPYDIVVREEPAQTLLFVEGTTSADLHVAAGTTLVAELLARLDRLGRRQIGPILCLLPPTPDETLLLQMCTEIVDPPPEAGVIELPAASVAVTRHLGPYQEIGLAEHSLYAWVEEHGLEPTGAIREVYRNDPAKVVPDALETDVLLPVIRPVARTPGIAAGRR